MRCERACCIGGLLFSADLLVGSVLICCFVARSRSGIVRELRVCFGLLVGSMRICCFVVRSKSGIVRELQGCYGLPVGSARKWRLCGAYAENVVIHSKSARHCIIDRFIYFPAFYSISHFRVTFNDNISSFYRKCAVCEKRTKTAFMPAYRVAEARCQQDRGINAVNLIIIPA